MRKGQKETANTADKVKRANDYAFAMSDLVNVVKKIDVPVEKHRAIIDSGTTSHFCPDRSKFIMFEPIEAQNAHTADGSAISAIGKGDVSIEMPLEDKKTSIILKNVLYTPKMAFTLVLTNHITSAGFSILFEDKPCKIMSPAAK